ncbi:DUF6443 domain-containing protein [Chitinophaga sp. CF418]|uniref:DUF6443 domain-containing protein n=1 Tax=Chitinophaga sp. CF418 TaxID=1855287 RepID=UPI00091E07C8|nr:DUF6443 domain-containing protein [Chitinophaga sp. CF418]SHN35725.1 RHS repeat-associated core domain-containing protein [Chitinophaga sp. CF418]
MNINVKFSLLFLIAGTLGYSPLSVAQTNIPSKVIGPKTISSGIATIPSAYQGNAKINYVRIRRPQLPLKDVNAVLNSGSVAEVRQETQYVDGLGRVLQTVKKGGSPGGKDRIQPVIYDEDGRRVLNYHPYVSSASNGQFEYNVFAAQADFMREKFPGEQVYYSKREFDGSPLNREIKTYSVGNSWVTRPVETRYQTNLAIDSVRIWNIGSGIPVSTGIYAAGQLFKSIILDEQGAQVLEYKDRNGQVVLKKSQVAGNPGTGHIGWLSTYYVYDNVGNLRFVITPLAIEAIKDSWTINSTIADELCFQYQYDEQQRVVMRKLPGSGREFMVYDVRNRLVFTQDSVQRTKFPMEWQATFYDGLNRPTMTAIYKASVTRDALQTSMNAATTSQSISYVAPVKADLALYNYDGSSLYVAPNSILFLDGFDSGNNSEIDARIEPSTVGDTTVILATNPLPNIPVSALTPLTYTFYDNYNYSGKLAFVATDTGKLEATDAQYPDRSPVSEITTGRVTGSKVRVLGTDKWLTTTHYYNEKGRSVQMISENNFGGKDVLTTLYNFNGAMLATYFRHQNPKSITPQSTLLTKMTYDHSDRLLTIRERLNDDAGLERLVVANDYNELGQLRLKRLGVTPSGAVIDSLNYSYNIRGWLQGINRNFVNNGNNTSNWFGLELSYDYGFDSSQYNGNIAGVKWKTRADSAWAYGYRYDTAGRLIKADFTQKNGGNWSQDKKDFTVSNLTYDANGNIRSMWQKGMIGTKADTIDRLTYCYRQNSNKLDSISDPNPAKTASAKLGDFLNGTNSGRDYFYDGNGNIVADSNKHVSAVTYNHLNLPVEIVIDGKGKITYQYDATGNRLSKMVTDNTGNTPKTMVTDYDGLFVYRQDSLELISHTEGRIRPVYKTGVPITYAFDYFERDNLGNVRTVLTDQSDFSMYAATMEVAAATEETALFSNVEESRADKPSGYPDDPTTKENKFVAKLNAKAGGKKIGPSLVLRVMAGDTVKINTKAFYKSQRPEQNKQNVPVEDMLIDLVKAFGLATNKGGDIHNSELAFNNTPFNENFYTNDYQRLKEVSRETPSSGRPKAYLNFVLFDDNFKLVESNSGVRQVKEVADELQELVVEKMPIEKSGFLYVYTSNESQQDVLFDNMILGLSSGPLLEETHYYPFGLTMVGISSYALAGNRYPKNRLEYNGIEHTSDLNLNEYDAFYRTFDPQIGRWKQIDPESERHPENTPYHHVFNNPALLSDPLGDDTTLMSFLPKVWHHFDPKTDVVRISGIKVTPNGGASDLSDRMMFGITYGFHYRVTTARSWAEDFLFGQRTFGNQYIDRRGNLTGHRVPMHGVPPNVSFSGVKLVELGGKIRRVITEYKWSSIRVKQAAEAIKLGETEVTVASRAEAEELYRGMFMHEGYINTTGMTDAEVKAYYGKTDGTYHWDDVWDPANPGRLMGHGIGNPHGDRLHLQIEVARKLVYYIFF